MKLDDCIVLLAASAGGLKALSLILSDLPEDFSAPIVVVQHISANYPSMLAQILDHRTSLIVKQAQAGDYLVAGTVYIAPPNHHLLINSDFTLSLSSSEKVHFSRPAVDVLFESVATSLFTEIIAVVLTGMDGDGAKGAVAIKKIGGTVIAQDEASSQFFGMPSSAIATGCVDLILPLDAIATTLLDLVNKQIN
jgi:two-component system, chemotaxis family, protein-glutamate methylesterase/glutaminase